MIFRVFPEIIFTVVLQRHPLFYTLSFILPCGLLSALNILVFILPTESGEKVSFGITNLLALVLFQQTIGNSLPPSSKFMPIISKYLFHCFHLKDISRSGLHHCSQKTSYILRSKFHHTVWPVVRFESTSFHSANGIGGEGVFWNHQPACSGSFPANDWKCLATVI